MADDCIEIRGGIPLLGNVCVGGAKNAVLPLMLATLLTADNCRLTNVPLLHDVALTSELLTQLGGKVEAPNEGELLISVPVLKAAEATYSLVRALRASFWVLGPLLARGRNARVAMPGGDIIGARPVDIHLEALSKMGADISVKGGVVKASAVHGLKPAEITFHFPSVGATHQVLMAAALTSGTTVINNAAREPEVILLGNALKQMGAAVEGLGTSTIAITGQKELGGYDQKLIGDRIEALTYILAGAVTGGSLKVLGFELSDLGQTTEALQKMGIVLQPLEQNDFSLAGNKSLKGVIASRKAEKIQSVNFKTGPFPEVATDHQALLMAALTLADGHSQVTETVYEGRFGHISELCRMGAKIHLTGQTAEIEGVNNLSGATVEARDIRAGAAMVIAGLAAGGTTIIEESHHLHRGYEKLEAKLKSIGAKISGSKRNYEDIYTVGC
jgi:UDP-N-acetylglucosamine 1-carboxyvinyltransferase